MSGDIDIYRLAELAEEMKRKQQPLDLLANALGISYSALRAKLYRAKKKIDGDDPFRVDLGEPWELEGDWMVIGDVHVPVTDYDLAMMVAAVAERQHIPNLLIAGDWFNMDAFSTYDPVISEPTWEQEKAASKELLDRYSKVFQEIRYLPGNHDRRISKKNSGVLQPIDILNNQNVMYSIRSWCWYTHPRTGKWRITHPDKYRKSALSLAGSIAQRNQCNVISFHEHHAGIGMDESGNWIVINGGGLFDTKKMSYVELEDTGSAAMSRGFVMLKNGYPYLFTDTITDWDMWI